MKRILIAEDDPISHKLLARTVQKMGYDPVSAMNGEEAWQILSRPDRPRIAILDWVMPEIHGPDVCRRVRQAALTRQEDMYTYLLLLTGRSKTSDITEGLQAGADDYLTKPFDRMELRCRLDVGERVLALNRALEDKIEQYKRTMHQLQRIKELLPICMHCHNVRDSEDRWQDLQAFLAESAGVNFSHSLCEECRVEHYPDLGQGSPEADSDLNT